MPLNYNDTLLTYNDPIAEYDGTLVMSEYYLRLLREVEATPENVWNYNTRTLTGGSCLTLPQFLALK